MLFLVGCVATDPDTGPPDDTDNGPAPAARGAVSSRLASTDAATSDSLARPIGPSGWEAADFARARSISLAEATRRLSWQPFAPRLAARLSAALATGFGGVWIDVHNGDRVQVGVTGRADRAAGAVRDAANFVGLREGYDVVAVRHALADLEALNQQIGAAIGGANVGADETLVVGLRTDLNAVAIDLPASGVLTAAQRELVTSATAKFGDMVVVGTYAGRPTRRACVYPDCDPPLRGGIRITNSEIRCTGAFIARGKTDSKLYQFTAGHCVGGPEGNWIARFSNGTTHVVGPVFRRVWDDSGDMAILEISNVPGWDPMPWVNVTSGPDTTANAHYEITADDTSVLGMRICTTGASFGRTDCGSVTELDVTVDVGGVTVHNLGRASYCGFPGDSGAPMFASHVAFGLQVHELSECDSLYQGIRAAENALDVNVLHAQ